MEKGGQCVIFQQNICDRTSARGHARLTPPLFSPFLAHFGLFWPFLAFFGQFWPFLLIKCTDQICLLTRHSKILANVRLHMVDQLVKFQLVYSHIKKVMLAGMGPRFAKFTLPLAKLPSKDAELGAMRVLGPKKGLFGHIWATSTHKWAKQGEMTKSGNFEQRQPSIRFAYAIVASLQRCNCTSP